MSYRRRLHTCTVGALMIATTWATTLMPTPHLGLPPVSAATGCRPRQLRTAQRNSCELRSTSSPDPPLAH